MLYQIIFAFHVLGVDVEGDRVVDLGHGVGVPDGAAVRGVQVGHALGAGLDGLDTAQLVCGLVASSVIFSQIKLCYVSGQACKQHGEHGQGCQVQKSR